MVLATGEDLVSLDDGVTSLEERRPARLQLHAIDDELYNKGVAMFGNERLGGTVGLVFAGSVEVPSRDGAILVDQRREKGNREPVLLDEFIGDNPEDLSPDFTNGVHTPVTWFVEGLVCRGIDFDVLKPYVRSGGQI